MLRYVSADIRVCTLSKYLVIIESRASYSLVTWLATSQELVKTFNLSTLSCLATFKLARRALYLAWLLVALNTNYRVYSVTTPSKFVRINLAFLPREFETPSRCRIQVVARSGCSSRHSVEGFSSSSLGYVYSTIKSARICAFMDDLGW